MKSVISALTLSVVAVLVFVLPSFASSAPPVPDPGMYAITHPFALATATTTRLFGMGGFVTCLPDAGFANPAFAATLSDTSTVVRESTTSFQSGLRLTGDQFSIATPLRPNHNGLQITGFRLQTDARLPGGFPPGSSVSLSEYEMALHYGQMIGNHLALGLGLSPVFHNNVSSDLGSHTNLLRLHSSSDQGFRLGALYKLDTDSYLGVIYDRYREDVTESVLGLGAPLAFGYTSEEQAVGYSRRLNRRVLAAVEWQQLTTKGHGTKQGDSGFRAGIEALLDNNVTFRAGTNDGSLSLGLGLTDHRLKLNYAYVNDWNSELVSGTLGHSATHQFEAAYNF